jgi:CheY-like chemotaxis protein
LIALDVNTDRPLLVVEDSDEDFDTACEAARRAGLVNVLHRATSGDACLSLLRGERVELLQPALVLLDLNLPGMDGREALREIRADDRAVTIPVVVLSTSADPRDLNACYRSGANAYHVKPVRYAEHLQMLIDLFAYWLVQAALPIPERPAR